MKLIPPTKEKFFIDDNKNLISTIWIRFFNALVTLGGVYVNTTKVTTAYNIITTDHVIFCDTDDGVFTVILPVGIEGQEFKIINCGSNLLTVTPYGVEELFGGGAGTSYNVTAGNTITIHFNVDKGWY